jgi:hypothetical protein
MRCALSLSSRPFLVLTPQPGAGIYRSYSKCSCSPGHSSVSFPPSRSNKVPVGIGFLNPLSRHDSRPRLSPRRSRHAAEAFAAYKHRPAGRASGP